jgi:hypothetical protein
MEHVPGVQLSGCWDSMSSSEHLQIIKSISDMIGQMAALEFPAFGSIYFQDAPIDPTLSISLDGGFCIGPHCNPVLWNSRPENPNSTETVFRITGHVSQPSNGTIAAAS